MRWLPLQVNTGAAEVLYSAVGEWAQLDQDSTVLDVCCGTGTIGISLAKVGTTDFKDLDKSTENKSKKKKKGFKLVVCFSPLISQGKKNQFSRQR